MQAWDEFLALQEIELGVETVNRWLKPLKVIRYDACNLYLEAKDSFQATWFEEHIRKKIHAQLVNNNHKKIKVHITLAQSLPRKQKNPSNQTTNVPLPRFHLTFDDLDPFCTFDNYIVSEENKLVEKLFKNLAGLSNSSPSQDVSLFNPIYIHGKQGVGKTHLLMALANALKKKGIDVLYSRAETFTQHVVSAIRIGEMSIFRQSYRNSDLLLIDDVESLSNKTATQEELFHTFNTLHLANKQIILSAPCAPSQLQHIEPRLISRFEWGIVLNLMPLEKQNLARVLKQKLEYLQFPLHEKVSDFLLNHFNGCKSLMKAVEALVLRSHLNGSSLHQITDLLTVPLAKQLLQDLLLEESQNAVTPQKIIRYVAEMAGVTSEDITGKAQTRDRVFLRQLAMYLCRQKLKIPYTKIGELFSKDHSTVMTSIKLIQKGLDAHDKEIHSALQEIEKKLDMNSGNT